MTQAPGIWRASTAGPWRQCEAQSDAIVGPRCTEPCRVCDDPQVTWGNGEPAGTYGDFYGGHFVCESVSGADKALILAAPDLLEAAKQAAQCIYTEEGLSRALGTLRAAIAKAEGRDAP